MPTCAECNFLPTRHQCVYCRVVHACPECCDKRGITVLSEITCKSCQEKNIAGTGSENDDNMIPPPEQNSTMEEQEIDCSTGRSNEGSKSNDRSGESDFQLTAENGTERAFDMQNNPIRSTNAALDVVHLLDNTAFVINL